MDFIPYGDTAILINFEQEISPAINDKVLALHHAIEAAAIPAIQYCIPAYCSLTVCYNPQAINYEDLCPKIQNLASKIAHQTTISNRKLLIPVCYEAPFSLDFSILLEQTKLSREAIIDLHCKTEFRVYMLGFLPGFAYMGKLPEALFCLRKENPRLRIPAGSVGLAGHQTGIYPIASPGGWQIIGQTPIPVFDANKEQAFLFQAGDCVRFEAISRANFLQIQQDISVGNYNWKNIYA